MTISCIYRMQSQPLLPPMQPQTRRTPDRQHLLQLLRMPRREAKHVSRFILMGGGYPRYAAKGVVTRATVFIVAMFVVYQICSFSIISSIPTLTEEGSAILSETVLSVAESSTRPKLRRKKTLTKMMTAARKPKIDNFNRDGAHSRPFTDNRTAGHTKERCDAKYLNNLGPIEANTSDMLLADVEKKYPQVHFGGWYTPADCKPQHRVALVVPFRNREHHLATFLNHMHPFLMKQKVKYGIFVVEQKGTQEFNRGKLLNVGYLFADSWECFVFHDVDLLPLDGRNLYTCPEPRAPRMYEKREYPWKDDIKAGNGSKKAVKTGLFRGVVAVTEEQFTTVNGYSNKNWGMGSEDNELYRRLVTFGYKILQYDPSITQYVELHPSLDDFWLQNKTKLNDTKKYRSMLESIDTAGSFDEDGLATVQYKFISHKKQPLFTHIVVDIDPDGHRSLDDFFQDGNSFDGNKYSIVYF